MAPKASIEINTPAAKVMEILCDWDEYKSWAPFTTAFTLQNGERVCKAEVGAVLIETVEMTPGATARLQSVKIVELSPEKIVWTFDLVPWAPFLLHAERIQTVSTISEGRCLYQTQDTMTGLLSPLVLALYGKLVQQGFERFSLALRQRAEEE